MNREEVLDILRTHKPTLAERFGVTELALFGSFARDEVTDKSDIDILVKFDKPATSKTYFGVQFYIEDLLGRPVDLVTEKSLRSELRPYVERDVVNVDSPPVDSEHPVNRIAGILDGDAFAGGISIDDYIKDIRGS